MQVGHQLRVLKNFTQEHMANSLKMTQSAYSKIETSETDVPYSKLEKIAAVLQIRPEDIIAFNEHIVFNVMHNLNGQNGLVINQQADENKKIVEDQIKSLKDEIVYLKSVLDRVLTK